MRHAVPGAVADSYANGEALLTDFKSGTPSGRPTECGVSSAANTTVVTQLTEGGKPMRTPYVNDTAPAVDVRAGGDPVFTGLANTDGARADCSPGTISAHVVLAGTPQVVIGPADLDLAEGVRTVVYAWGSDEDGNLKLARRDHERRSAARREVNRPPTLSCIGCRGEPWRAPWGSVVEGGGRRGS